MKTLLKSIRQLVLASSLALPLATVQAQEVFKIDEITRAGGTISIRFTDSRPVELTGSYSLDATGSVTPPIQWTNSTSAVFSILGGNQYQVTAPEYSNMSFYRVLSLGGLDTDGDGVPDAVEVALGTDPNVPDWIQDTDGDGYSDGLEIVNGSNPTDANSRILRGLQPEVQFGEETSRALESAGAVTIPFQFNTNYSGQVHYSLSVMSTATDPADFTHAQNGVVSVHGGTGTISLNLVDDLGVEDIEAIVLQLEDDAAGTYHTGAFATHTVLLIDNDANWSGLLKSSVGETSFRLRVLQFAAAVSALLIPSPKATAGHLGGQVIPLPPAGQTGWPLADLTVTPAEFIGTSPPLPAGSSRLLGGVELARTLSFSAVPPPEGGSSTIYITRTNASFGAVMIAGEFTEVLAPAQQLGPALQFTNRGSFILAREAVVMTPLEVPITTAP